MSSVDLLMVQLTEILRFGLLVGLVVTALRTRAEMGLAVPVALGVVFVAVILPGTAGPPAGVTFLHAVLVGIVTNAILLAAIAAGWMIVRRLRGR